MPSFLLQAKIGENPGTSAEPYRTWAKIPGHMATMLIVDMNAIA